MKKVNCIPSWRTSNILNGHLLRIASERSFAFIFWTPIFLTRFVLRSYRAVTFILRRLEGTEETISICPRRDSFAIGCRDTSALYFTGKGR